MTLNSLGRYRTIGARKLLAALYISITTVLAWLGTRDIWLTLLIASGIAGLAIVAYLVIATRRHNRADLRAMARRIHRLETSLFRHVRATSPSERRTKTADALDYRLNAGFTTRALRDLHELALSIGAKSSQRTSALMSLAAWHNVQGDTAQALHYASLARIAGGDSPAPRPLMLEADLSLRVGRVDEAETLLLSNPLLGDADWHLRMANTYAHADRPDLQLSVLNLMYELAELGSLQGVPFAGGPGSPGRLFDADATQRLRDAQISAIVPVLTNGVAPEAIRSLLAQSLPPNEVLLVASPAVISKFRSLESAAIRLVPSDAFTEAGLVADGLRSAAGDIFVVCPPYYWNHPERLERQSRSLGAPDGAVATICRSARMDIEGNFIASDTHSNSLLTSDTTLLAMERRTFERVGVPHAVSVDWADEYVDRIRTLYGHDSVRIAAATAPLAVASTELDRTTPADLAPKMHAMSARRLYRHAYRAFHQSSDYHRLSSSALESAPPGTPNVLLRSDSQLIETDLVVMSNLSLPGGTTASIAQEIQAQRSSNLLTALIHHPVFDWGVSRSINPKLLALCDGRAVQLASVEQTISADLLVIRLPKVVEHLIDRLPSLEVKHIAVVINQTPWRRYDDSAPEPVYSLRRCAESLGERFGLPVTWHPIGPTVREALLNWHSEEVQGLTLSETDWVNIIDISQWRREMRVPSGTPLVLGRHSRDTREKFPQNPETLRRAYPEDRGIEIRVLGGTATPESVLGALPSNWRSFPFDSIAPRAFLQDLDFYVYFTMEGLAEAFGRSILEALAVGVPVIAGHQFKPLFGDAVIYAEPDDVRDVIREYASDPDRYLEQVRRGWDLVEAKFSYQAHIRRLAELGVSTAAKMAQH